MSNRFDIITQQLFQKNFDECSEADLQTIAHQFPYFASVQFALTKKLQATGSSDYQLQLQKAVLYYHDPVSFIPFLDSEENIPQLNTFIPEEQPTSEPVIEIAEQENGINVNEITTIEPEQAPSTEKVQEQFAEPVAKSVEEQKIAAPVATEETALAFEPYHTIDYFASQGIKLSQDEVTKDKFGKQLKSFTEWLKTMKRLPPVEQAKTIDTVSQQKVENLAADSVQSEDVVTEAMADVWLKQGNTEKAIDIYNKLSLQNPSKRAYFAAKLDSLKKEI